MSPGKLSSEFAIRKKLEIWIIPSDKKKKKRDMDKTTRRSSSNKVPNHK